MTPLAVGAKRHEPVKPAVKMETFYQFVFGTLAVLVVGILLTSKVTDQVQSIEAGLDNSPRLIISILITLETITTLLCFR